MRVRYKTISAGAGGCVLPGAVRDEPDAYAQVLIEGGYAEAIDPLPVKEAAKEPDKEAPVAPKAPVRALAHKPYKKGK